MKSHQISRLINLQVQPKSFSPPFSHNPKRQTPLSFDECQSCLHHFPSSSIVVNPVVVVSSLGKQIKPQKHAYRLVVVKWHLPPPPPPPSSAPRARPRATCWLMTVAQFESLGRIWASRASNCLLVSACRGVDLRVPGRQVLRFDVVTSPADAGAIVSGRETHLAYFSGLLW